MIGLDPLGVITVYTRNARGDVTSVTYADGTADEATAYAFCNRDGTVEYTLDELGRRVDAAVKQLVVKLIR